MEMTTIQPKASLEPLFEKSKKPVLSPQKGKSKEIEKHKKRQLSYRPTSKPNLKPIIQMVKH